MLNYDNLINLSFHFPISFNQEDEENCVLDCPQNTSCAAQTCCGPKKETLTKLNIHNGVYKGYGENGPTAIRRRPRNDQGSAECELLEIPLSEINVEIADIDNSDDDDDNNDGPDVKLTSIQKGGIGDSRSVNNIV